MLRINLTHHLKKLSVGHQSCSSWLENTDLQQLTSMDL